MSKNMKNIFKSLNKKYYIFLFFVLIALIYLHPVFYGKVDTPIDIRDALMYPWRYHSVDKKIKMIDLWESKFQDTGFNLKISPNNTSSAAFKLEIDKTLLSKQNNLSNSNYYISFDFKPITSNGETLNFGLLLVNNITKQIYTPGVAITPISQDKKGQQSSWYKAYFNLNNFVSKLTSIDDLNHYSIQIAAKNTSKNSLGSLYLRDLKLACDDFSSVTKVHNYFINDLIQMFTPFREYFSESLKSGKLPFWNNYIFSGTEFLAEPQVGYFHPLYFLSYLFFDHFTAHTIIIFICFVLCGIGAFLLASYWGLGLSASLLSGIVYMFQPFNVTWFSYEHMLMNSATLPFLLLAYEKNINNNKLLNKYLLLSALLLGLIFLSGHLQYIYYTMIFLFLVVVFRFFVDRSLEKKYLLQHIFSALFVFLFAFLISMIVVLPFFPLFLNSHRIANSLEHIRKTSIPLKAFLGLLYPYYGGHPFLFNTSASMSIDPAYKAGFFNNYVYFGLLPFLISLLSLKNVFQNKLTIFFLISVSFSLLVCTGSPIFFLLRDVVPGFKEMQHFRFLQLYSYSVPFLAGFGFKVLMDRFLIFKRKIGVIIISIILLISIIDLMYYSSYFITWSNKKDYKSLPENGALKFLIDKKNKSKEPFRILPFAVSGIGETKLKINVAQPNTLLPYKLEEVSGYSSFVPKDIYYLFVYIQSKDPNKLYPKELVYFFTNPNIPYPIFNFKSKVLDLLNVKYFLVPNVLTLDSPDVEKVFGGDCTIYENKNYLPRAFIVPNHKIIESSKDTIIELDSEKFDPRKEVILMSTPDVIARSVSDEAIPSEIASGLRPRNDNKVVSLRGAVVTKQSPNVILGDIKYKINFLKYENNNITLKVNVTSPGFLVLGHNLNNNWKVKINHKEGEHYQANLIQRAIYLPEAGNYLIEFYYFPKLFFIGFGISCFAFFMIFLLTIYLKSQNRTRIKMKSEIKQENILVKL